MLLGLPWTVFGCSWTACSWTNALELFVNALERNVRERHGERCSSCSWTAFVNMLFVNGSWTEQHVRERWRRFDWAGIWGQPFPRNVSTGTHQTGAGKKSTCFYAQSLQVGPGVRKWSPALESDDQGGPGAQTDSRWGLENENGVQVGPEHENSVHQVCKRITGRPWTTKIKAGSALEHKNGVRLCFFATVHFCFLVFLRGARFLHAWTNSVQGTHVFFKNKIFFVKAVI